MCFGKRSTPRNDVVTISTTTTIDAVCRKPLNTLSVRACGNEENDYSTSNFDSKSHATEVTTISSDADELHTPISSTEINTISHQVASTTQQQHAIAVSTLTVPQLNVQCLTSAASGAGSSKLLSSIPNPLHKLAKRRQLLEARRERKAAQTLAIITGAFVICWLPFFVMALFLSLCKTCTIHETLASIFLWLGYFNSTLNPIIYTVFNPEFRRAFQRIVYGRQLPPTNSSRKM